jgi:hypothetical protein
MKPFSAMHELEMVDTDRKLIRLRRLRRDRSMSILRMTRPATFDTLPRTLAKKYRTCRRKCSRYSRDVAHRFFVGLLLCLYPASLCLAQASGQAVIPDRFKGIILNAPLIDPPANYYNLGANSAILRSRGARSQTVSSSLNTQGVYRMMINQKTGGVDEVGVLTRSGNKQCDAAAVMAFFKWKFKPGTLKQLDAPVMFSRSIDINLKKAGSK